MNRINRKVEYALMGLKHMRAKAPGELTTAKELSTIYGCPFDVMSRVLQTLSKKGLVRSEQGAYGGYQLCRDLARVSFHELTEMILGDISVAKCIHSEPGEVPCEIRETCNIVSPVAALNRRMIEFYKSVSVLELLEPRSAEKAKGPSRLSRAATTAASVIAPLMTTAAAAEVATMTDQSGVTQTHDQLQDQR